MVDYCAMGLCCLVFFLGLNLLSVVMDAMFDSWFVAGGFHLDGIGDFALPF